MRGYVVLSVRIIFLQFQSALECKLTSPDAFKRMHAAYFNVKIKQEMKFNIMLQNQFCRGISVRTSGGSNGLHFSKC